jgi:hypothetical protein
MDLPLTKQAQELDFVSFGLAILSHKGRGYEGRVSRANPWPKLARDNLELKL